MLRAEALFGSSSVQIRTNYRGIKKHASHQSIRGHHYPWILDFVGVTSTLPSSKVGHFNKSTMDSSPVNGPATRLDQTVRSTFRETLHRDILERSEHSALGTHLAGTTFLCKFLMARLQVNLVDGSVESPSRPRCRAVHRT
ncbi:hypothetical protein EVAR_42646_1 [Eumeta japonica]|uniref:Uncharacterized protein n=1 Tax=Eumeta variegata TaxID=151549 RepID=A0A4C1WX68_EUMVA|nr:hypothetical protein EVAR_42646_1 [Eumeta japonica]